jgi:SSS family solute:Na+ symporter
MRFTPIDWLVVAGYFVFMLCVGMYFRKKASASTDEFFVSGRQVSWWLAGTSMVATTFAADTPLAVTGLVATQGIAGNWFWWSLAFSGMMTVFFFARLWRRSEVITDVEFVELRYSGKAAAFLRGFRSVYFGVLMNCVIIGWVNLAMEKILGISLGISKEWAVVILFGIIAITSFYAFLSGLWGVLWTDLFQFVLMMSMVILLAYYAVEAVGGMSVMMQKLAVIDAARTAEYGGSGSVLSFIPDLHSPWMPILTFGVYLGVNWWANWYPGAEPGGGGYIAQRIFSAKDEKHSLWATLWFNIAHYALRPWPWILTALASLILYPHLADPETGYIRVWFDHFPGALRGLMLAGFLAAYMSTIATQLNWGSSYIVNDLYQRFLVRNRSQRHYVITSKIVTAFIAVAGAGVSLLMQRVTGGWELIMGIGAGTGAVYMLRWYWWRINAWSEVSSMTAALLVTVGIAIWKPFAGSSPIVFAKSILLTVSITTIVWLAATFLTEPEPDSTLVKFYRKVRPDATGWKHVAALAPEVPPTRDNWYNLMDWLLGCLMIYMTLFGIGKLVLGSPGVGLIFLLVAAASGYAIYWDFSRRGWETLSGREGPVSSSPERPA